jgi:uncharacterized protein (DUF1330 family)
MPAYVIAEVEVTDPVAFQDYLAKAMPTLAECGARLIARGAAVSKEGTAPAGAIVIAEFKSLADAERWYGSPAYSACIPLRQRAASTRLFFVDGEPG